MKIYTTLNKIKASSPCGLREPKNTNQGWGKLLAFLNKTEADDKPIDLLTILESNGVEDCIWAFRTTDDHPIYRHIAADFSESILHIFEAANPNDNRPRLAIQAARDYADGKIGSAALAAANDAANDVAYASNASNAAYAASAAYASNAASASYAAREAWADWAASEFQKQHSILVKWLS